MARGHGGAGARAAKNGDGEQAFDSIELSASTAAGSVAELPVAQLMAAAAQPPPRPPQRLTVLLSGLGLLTDIYDFQVINLARGFIEATRPDAPMSAVDEALITSAAIVGAIVGMLCFGALADRVGRRTMFLATAVLTTAGALGSALADSPGAAIYTELASWRFVMGLGIGGEYPLSAANTAEHAQARGGRQLATTFSMMGWGGLLAPVVFLALQALGAPADATWRLGFGLGAVLSSAGVLLRLACLRDAPRFVDARRQGLRASARGGGYVRRTAALLCAYRRPLLGTGGVWFLYDTFEYGLNLYTASILHQLRPGGGAEAEGEAAGAMRTTLGVLALRALTIPGYLLAIWLIDAAGRRRTLDGGFVSMGLCFGAIGALWPQMQRRPLLFVLVFGLAQVCDNAGCGVATYVIPAEIYTSSMRATCHGVSAAAGKLGAAVGAAAFPLVERAYGLRAVFVCCAAVCVLGLGTSRAFVPDYDEPTVAELDGAHARGDYLAVLYGAGAGERRRRRAGAVQLDDLSPSAHSTGTRGRGAAAPVPPLVAHGAAEDEGTDWGSELSSPQPRTPHANGSGHEHDAAPTPPSAAAAPGAAAPSEGLAAIEPRAARCDHVDVEAAASAQAARGAANGCGSR